ncbi:hypothetical protein K435DRAFT_555066, partial [Dendrothele bispora CBS 962.96]
SIEESTRSNYATGARDYIRFCTSHNLPLDPTPSTLSCYVAFTSRHTSRPVNHVVSWCIASAPKYLTGARHYLKDIYPYFDDSRSSPLVQATIRGSKKVRGDPVHRKPPLRTSHIQSFVDKATHSQKYDDLLFATIIACAFYGCHRTEELVVPNRKALCDWHKIIKRSTLRFDGGHA